ncbi:MAG: Tetratricopeptide repeat protein [Candidatus Methanofastidiosum methylothiophilum]|uniref:Tetratricopeptide repeat protein n=1 Tax=Candidatus Methanofastidiosum methylothiophilum TaxID=1705564 RepID=A0A150ITH3_9EURY|nr:MAG: Tetratricopeptide repeat protein [Candidatus Methanofastidiosum methylthiophilus]KYC48175.1 MAG: Tetratricopeptide repeat protein [Candidatus Methanofastidiosum methylthiophilus]KYC50830.1 MAG: Tetratricopeptide repeat protein [Candidatus Methanofastidiosum methylthiophilus]
MVRKKKVPLSFWEEQLAKEKLDNKDPERVKFIRNVLISEYTSLYEKFLDKGNYKKTNEINDKIHELKKEIDVSSKEEVVWLFEKKALDYLQKSSYDEAISYFKIALEKSLVIPTIKPEEIRNIKESLKKAYFEKGSFYLNQDKFDDAISAFRKILEFCVENSGKKSEETKDALNSLIICYNQKGEYLAKRERFEDAINTIDKAIEITNDMGIETETAKSAKKNIAKIQTLFAFNQIDKGLYDSAINHLKRILDMSLEIYGNDSEEYIEAKNNLLKGYNAKGRNLLEKSRYDEAISAFEKSVELSKDGKTHYSRYLNDSIDGIIKSYYQKSSVYEEYGKYEEAISNLEKALKIATKYQVNKIRTSYITDKLFLILKTQYESASRNYNTQQMREILDIALNLIRSGYNSINFDENTIRIYFEKIRNQKTEEGQRRTKEEYQERKREEGKEKQEKKKSIVDEISIKELLIKFELEDNGDITKEIIKEQYRYWVDLLHPDKNINKSDATIKKAEEKLKEINIIYKKLIEHYP